MVFLSGLIHEWAYSRDEKNVSKIGGLIQKACPRASDHTTFVITGNDRKTN